MKDKVGHWISRYDFIKRSPAWAVVVGILIIVSGFTGCGGESNLNVLPLGENDPHAVTEEFLALNPEAALKMGHVTIFLLEPTGTHEGDTGEEEGVDSVQYFFDSQTELSLQIHESAEQVQRLVLKDDAGREVARCERCVETTVTLEPGAYVLEVHHALKGQADATTQTIFLRPVFETTLVSMATKDLEQANVGDTATLEASNDCENCDFKNSDLRGKDFSGLNLSGSNFANTVLIDAKFINSVMMNCNLVSTVIPFSTNISNTDFTGANLTGARFGAVGGMSPRFVRAILDSTTWVADFQGGGFGAFISKADFSGASMINVVFGCAVLDGSTFRGATIESTSFSNIPCGTGLNPSCKRCDFSSDPSQNILTSIMATTFQNADLTGVNFTGTLLHGVSMNGKTVLVGVDFSRLAPLPPELPPPLVIFEDFSGDLTGTNFSGFNLFGNDLSQADLSKAIISDPDQTNFASFVGATLSDGVSHGVNLSGHVFPDGFTQFQGQDLAYANLSGVRLFKADLEEAILTGVDLTDADLAEANMKQVILINAKLNGANLNFVNLEEANLCGAKLNKSPNTQTSARLGGAYLKNVNLAQADFSGAEMTNVNFYSSVAATLAPCVPVNCSISTLCASAVNATMNSTNFSGAYLNGVDMSDSVPQGATFSGALLVGVNFTKANLSGDHNTGHATDFTGAFLQGANFTDATVTDANFSSAYVDVTSTSGACMVFLLDGFHTAFTGYWNTPGTPICVQFLYTTPTTLPETNSENTCPDGNSGPCSLTQWQSPKIPIAQAETPSASSSDCSTMPGGCSKIDFMW